MRESDFDFAKQSRKKSTSSDKVDLNSEGPHKTRLQIVKSKGGVYQKSKISFWPICCFQYDLSCVQNYFIRIIWSEYCLNLS